MHTIGLYQFPFIATGQPGYVYGPQPVFVHPSVAAAAAAAAAHAPFSQTHQSHGQPTTVEHYQGAANEPGGMQQGQIQAPTAMHQAYGAAGDQFYGQYVHPQQQPVIYQPQGAAGTVSSTRHNSITAANSGPPLQQQQPYQHTIVQGNQSQPS
ncbi:unnamed protein product [Gongylonema pulchrum]|uniref:PUM-HD domain-containing protein n=1 Tax=Gongylonema pulchrum TaxID=637853 RepID=A0A183EAF9_9BILA|nr:unnamed protein product [Gongylonema pulchrum]